jgi:uncharacterized protein (TIGR00369 family)
VFLEKKPQACSILDRLGILKELKGRPMRDRKITEQRADFLKADYERGFIKFCGLKAVAAEWGRFRSRVDIEEEHRQQDGFIHAGVMATMADHTAGYSAFTIVPTNMQILTIEFKVNFLRPAFGNALVCDSIVIREGKQIIVSESEVFDVRDDGEYPVAKAMVTLMAVPQEKLSKGKNRDKLPG